jgi:hypothetical protein
MVGNTVDVGWPTIKSGCLPTTAPRLPNCNSFRCFVFGDSEVWVIEKSRNKTKYLNQKMKEVMGSFNRDTVVTANKSLRSRI